MTIGQIVSYLSAIAQVVCFVASMLLLRRVKATNKTNRAELARWDEIAKRGEEDAKAIEAYTLALNDLVALHLAIRLQTPQAYWYS